MNIAIWILVALISLAFVFFSMVKLFGVPTKLFEEQKEIYMGRYGLSRTQVRLIGLLEIFGGLTILLWATPYLWLAQIGMATLVFVTVGAISFHARYDSVFKDGLPAVIQFVLNSSLLVYTLFFM